MMDREIIIKFRQGTLRINGGPATTQHPEREVEVNGYTVRLINVPEVDRPGIESLEYCPYYDNLSEIMLLEETEYQVLIEGAPDAEFTPSSGNLFRKMRFDLEGKTAGILNFKSYAGKSFLGIRTWHGTEEIPVEVRSKKINYHEQYPAMLADLSEEITSIILESDSSTYQFFSPMDRKKKTLYEDFLLLEHIFRPRNLPAAAEYINHNFYSGLEREVDVVPAALASAVDADELPMVISDPTSIDASGTPLNLPHVNLRETPDTPENRFYRYFLENLEDLILELLETAPEGYLKDSLMGFRDEVNILLSAGWLREVGTLRSLPLNSQVLQKREGYRDILRYFFMLDLSLRFTWDELEDALEGFERRLSELYEYWCYFKIIRILEDITGDRADPSEIFYLRDWKVSIRRGNSILSFRMDDVRILLSYNGRFTRDTGCRSYSLPFRPDYSILVDVGECTYFIHLDAKYRSTVKLEDFYEDVDLRDRREELERDYRDGDVYKMHTYKDAILHSRGAYILYPGSEEVVFQEDDGHEVPSVGAFPLNPGGSEDDEGKLRDFLEAVILELMKYKN